MIVDLQRKNQDLKMKVEMMSEAALNGNGEDLNSYDRYHALSPDSVSGRVRVFSKSG